jgi:hypothetical protein
MGRSAVKCRGGFCERNNRTAAQPGAAGAHQGGYDRIKQANCGIFRMAVPALCEYLSIVCNS